MAFMRQLALYIALTSTFFLVIGLFRPWIMLWWEDVQNRRKVIRLYGTIAVVAVTFYFVFYFISDHDQ
jgi:hypothetical protein